MTNSNDLVTTMIIAMVPSNLSQYLDPALDVDGCHQLPRLMYIRTVCRFVRERERYINRHHVQTTSCSYSGYLSVLPIMYLPLPDYLNVCSETCLLCQVHRDNETVTKPIMRQRVGDDDDDDGRRRPRQTRGQAHRLKVIRGFRHG